MIENNFDTIIRVESIKRRSQYQDLSENPILYGLLVQMISTLFTKKRSKYSEES